MDVPADVLHPVDEGEVIDLEVKPQLTCAACGAIVPKLLYRDEDGWRCERCAPARRPCEYHVQGCTHTDISLKCTKHETYFCQQRTLCFLCRNEVSRGSLSSHYDSAHETYGSTWRTKQVGWQCCLVSTVAGTAVCEYWFDNEKFVLDLTTPVPSERLSEFRCTVRLTHLDTGQTHTCTPNAYYTEDYDWRSEVESEEFQTWSSEYDICVDITRVETK